MPTMPALWSGTPGWGSLRRWGVFAIGGAALFSGIALTINAGLGVGSWQVLETGLVAVTGASFGTVILLEALVCLTVAWWWLGQRPWIATALLGAGGIPIGLLVATMPTPEAIGSRLLMLTVGMALLAIGVAFYLASDLGASAQDALFVGMYQRWTIRPSIVRFGLDATVVLAGIVLGGQFGIGTFAVTIAVPLLIEPALRLGHRLADTPVPEALRRSVVVAATTSAVELLVDLGHPDATPSVQAPAGDPASMQAHAGIQADCRS